MIQCFVLTRPLNRTLQGQDSIRDADTQDTFDENLDMLYNFDMTPMMQQYTELKKQVPEHILFFRLGDFYEMFYEDAKLVSRELGLTLTGRGDGEGRVPMCGVPHHASTMYIKRLIDRGYSIAMCEQLTQPQKGVKMVERGIVKIVTPGTLIDDEFLDGKQNNFVASVFFPQKGETGSISWADISTGEFYSIDVNNKQAFIDILARISPKEIIHTEEFKSILGKNFDIRSSAHYNYAFNPLTAHEMILNYFKIKSTKVFDFELQSAITPSAGALLEYLYQTQKKSMANITGIKVIRSAEAMFLDRNAREHLELTKSFREGKAEGSLLWVLDDTKTAMGSRLLTHIIQNPLQDIARIGQRQEAIELLIGDNITAKKLRDLLGQMTDLSRLTGRIASRTVSPRDLVGLRASLQSSTEVKKALLVFGQGLLKKTQEDIQTIPELVTLIDQAIAENPPAKLDEGGYIKEGYNKELDELRSLSTQGNSWLSKLESAEREECKIKELKIGFNRVTGYYFEIPKRFSTEVPFRLKRIATTTNTERYVTDELKSFERKILTAHDNARQIESKILFDIREKVSGFINPIKQNAECIAVVDVLCSLAIVANANRWIRPKMNDSGLIQIKEARHPVVEKILGRGQYIANDCNLQQGKKSTKIITGPNMAGKSTYMRSIAMCVLLSHIGSFIPATSADISIVDRIFTRIGASDSLLTGESTFMVEMNEVSTILNNATPKSLILLDEVGRGTGTQDGLALAIAITNYVTNKIGSSTMFATHFHQLVKLSEKNPKITNYRATTAQSNGQIVFLHKIEPGIEENSFGIDVAKLAGIPSEIIDEARKLYSKNN
ncbi:MAG: DNA mismatch repair protein MutS [Firmicutes bacterium]|nr:DNA mismatch repair protein MutS [Bacillota bacterium]